MPLKKQWEPGALSLCPYCRKRCTSSRGLGVHLTTSKCKLRYRPHFNDDLLTSTSGSSSLDGVAAPAPDPDEEVVDDVEAEIVEQVISIPYAGSTTVTLDDVQHLESVPPIGAPTTTRSSTLGRRLTLQATRTIKYSDPEACSQRHPHAGRPAGTPLHSSRTWHERGPFDDACKALDLQKNVNLDTVSYAPFDNRAQFGLAMHFEKYHTSQGEIDAWLNNPDVPFTGSTEKMKDAKSFFDTLTRIPYGIANDEWVIETLCVQRGDGYPPVQYPVYRRNIEEVIRFLIGHPPFRDHILYEPIQEFDERGERLYMDFMTADWAWAIQDKLSDGATLLPIKIYSDKTCLTNTVGETTFHPVAIQLLNHSNELLNRQDQPNFITVGFIPVISSSESRTDVKYEVFQLAMSLIFEPLINLAQYGTDMLCADGWYRRCHPVIAGISADYEEQVAFTGIKQTRQCPVCQVPHHYMERIYGQCWDPRTDDWTLTKHRYQQDNPNPKPNPKTASAKQKRKWREEEANRVHLRWNFLWEHPYSDTHDIIMADPLHQIDKGLIQNVIDWLKLFEPSDADTLKNGVTKDTHAQFLARLNAHFAAVPSVTDFRSFKDFTGIQHWTGEWTRAALFQMAAALAGIYQDTKPERLIFINALTNIAYIVRSKVVSESMLYYLENELFVLDLMKHTWNYARAPRTGKKKQGTKNVGSDALPSRLQLQKSQAHALSQLNSDNEPDASSDSDDGLDGPDVKYPAFNIPKWHSLSHYAQWIRSKGSTQCGCTSRGEAGHRPVKSFYKRTNKTGNWVEQMCRHVSRSDWLVSMRSYRDWLKSRMDGSQFGVTPTNDPETLNITTASADLADLNALHWKYTPPGPGKGFQPKHWRCASTIGDELGISVFNRVIATLIRNERARIDQENLTDWTVERLILGKEPSWAPNVWVALHNSLACYRQTAKTAQTIGHEAKQRVWCSYKWRKVTGEERRDYVWVQDHPDADDNSQDDTDDGFDAVIEPSTARRRRLAKKPKKAPASATLRALDGRRIGQLVAIVTVLDPERCNDRGGPLRHHGVILEMLNYEGGEVYHPTTRMIRLVKPTKPQYRPWSLDFVLRTAHVVPLKPTEDSNHKFVVNYASDWDAWMTLAPDDFLDANARAAINAFDKNVATGKWGGPDRPFWHRPVYQEPPPWVVDAGLEPPSLINDILARPLSTKEKHQQQHVIDQPTGAKRKLSLTLASNAQKAPATTAPPLRRGTRLTGLVSINSSSAETLPEYCSINNIIPSSLNDEQLAQQLQSSPAVNSISLSVAE
jgi:hypothetical protein